MLRLLPPALLLLTLLPALPAAAGEARLRLLAPGFDVPADRRIRLEPVGLHDIVTGPPQLDAGAGNGMAQRTAEGLAFAPGRASVRQVDLRVRRQVPLRWQLDQPLERRSGAPRVRVSCEGLAGQVGGLTHVGSGERLPARVDSPPGRAVGRLDNREIVEGELWLEFDLGSIRHGGTYEGRIVLDLEYL